MPREAGSLASHFLISPAKKTLARCAAVEKSVSQLGRGYDLIIGGNASRRQTQIRSLNPTRPSEIVGIHQKAGKEQVEPAMKAALKAFES
jgi:1-pyrroline-5-carboxylate dehydrogenase